MSILSSFQNIFKIAELKSRVIFTLALLAVYRVGAHIPTPGIRGEELSKFLLERGGALMGFFDMFSGGALSRVTIFALGIAAGIETMANGAFVQNPGWSFRLMTMITLTSGTAFIMWLGEQITERGIGNGISLIIFAGIVARFPQGVIKTIASFKTG